MSYQPDWDIDLRAGKNAERLVLDLITDDTLEVKHDRKARYTGKLYVETHCRRRDGWHPSGISTTKATVWFFVLETEDKMMVSLSTDALRREVARFAHSETREETDGSHPTRGVTVPLAAVLRAAVQRAA